MRPMAPLALGGRVVKVTRWRCGIVHPDPPRVSQDSYGWSYENAGIRYLVRRRGSKVSLIQSPTRFREMIRVEIPIPGNMEIHQA